jgi:hypothetical protein
MTWACGCFVLLLVTSEMHVQNPLMVRGAQPLLLVMAISAVGQGFLSLRFLSWPSRFFEAIAKQQPAMHRNASLSCLD